MSNINEAALFPYLMPEPSYEEIRYCIHPAPDRIQYSPLAQVRFQSIWWFLQDVCQKGLEMWDGFMS